MAFDYNDFLTEVRTLLRNNATTTALNASLTSDYVLASDHINIGVPENIPVQTDQYPYIFITLKNVEEEFANVGISSTGMRRHLTLNVDLTAFTYLGSDSNDSDKNARTLARNIHSVFRSNTNYATTTGWDQCLIGNTVFDRAYVEPNNKDVFLSAVKMEAQFKKYSVF